MQCEPECVSEFEQMKIRSAYSYIVFKITDDKKFITIDCKGEKGASFEEFCSKLPDGECRYAVLDVEINTKSGATTNKLIFVAWSDDNASIKPKMLYASSKDAIKKALTGARAPHEAMRNTRHRHSTVAPQPLTPASRPKLLRAGINDEYQATDRGDLDLAEIKKKAGGV